MAAGEAGATAGAVVAGATAGAVVAGAEVGGAGDGCAQAESAQSAAATISVPVLLNCRFNKIHLVVD